MMKLQLTEVNSRKELLRFYEDQLLNQIMPFWLRHCIDWDYGGLLNHVQDDGQIISTDKFTWSQGRALWTFSALYNDLNHEPAWLRIAQGIFEFLSKYGRGKTGEWVFRLSRDGRVLDPQRSIYVDGFVIYGLTEYARATGDRKALDLALETYERTIPLLADHSCLPTKPLPIPKGFQAHGPSMIFAMVCHDLGVMTGKKEIQNHALRFSEIIMSQHLKPDRKLLYEFVRPGGEVVNNDAGNTFVPGHAIESMWVMERVYQHHSRQDRVSQAIEAIRWHLERGWDREYGGLFLACHAEGGAPVFHAPYTKIWWTLTESLYALLRAYELTGERWCSGWHSRVHDYAFTHYPNRQHGEWIHNLDRYGRRTQPVMKDLPVKDVYHLPRALIYAIQVLRRLTAPSSLACPQE